MPDNKRQHYVPASTLRRFAADPWREKEHDRCQINLINIKRKKLVYIAALKKQCYGDYFYGKNLEVERSLGAFERLFNDVSRSIIQNRRIDPQDKHFVTQMISLQYARTQHTEAIASQMSNHLFKMYMYGRIDDETRALVKLRFDGLAARLAGLAMSLSPMLLDLREHVLVSDGDVPLILSDNPVVMTNRFCRSRFPGVAGTGLSKSGLQIYMPLSPRCAIMLHDGGVYKTKENTGLIELSGQDVQSLNGLQYHNALSNVYFAPETPATELSRLLELEKVETALTGLRRYSRTLGSDAYVLSGKNEFDAPDEDAVEELVSFRATPLPFDLRLRAVGMKTRPKYHQGRSLHFPLRDPAWSKIVSDFSKEIEAGRGSFEDLWVFVSKHPCEGLIGPWIDREIARASRTRTGQA